CARPGWLLPPWFAYW
nr:immunoglobulin heavy chain junction region [Mus musculus]MBK4189737.1 immunoglobulin heavy chain junction region [Mus musculus]